MYNAGGTAAQPVTGSAMSGTGSFTPPQPLAAPAAVPPVVANGLTDNQIHGIFNTQLGRDASPYEIQKYGPASIQTLANIGSTYSKLDPNSIVDYLTSIGQDPSLKNRQALGVQYGIANVGTAEGNTSLLNALKIGAAPSKSTVSGSIISPYQTPVASDPSTSQDGSQTATPTDPTAPVTIDTDPTVVAARSNVASAYGQQQSAQQALAGLDSQIAGINNTIASSLQNKRDEIARNGGIVDESQLQSMVVAQNAPLIAERNTLMSNRSQYVNSYTTANNNYQKAVSDQKDAEANFKAQATINQGQEKIDQASQKMTIQQQQFSQKLEQSGYKLEKVNQYDQYGNVVGQASVWMKNPSDSTGFTADGDKVSVGGGSSGNGISAPTPSTGDKNADSLFSTLGNYNGTKYITPDDLNGFSAKEKNALKNQATALGIKALSTKDSDALTSIKTAQSDLNDFQSFLNTPGLLPSDSSGVPLSTADVTLNDFFGYNPQLGTFDTWKAGIISEISALKGTGSSGGSSGASLFGKIEEGFPSANQPLDQAMAKINTINQLISNGGNSILGISPSSQVPTDVVSGSTINYQGKAYSVDAEGNLTPQ